MAKLIKRVGSIIIPPYSINEGVTQSMLSGWASCRVSSQNALAGWEVPRSKHALRWGLLMHYLLEEWYTLKMNRKGKSHNIPAFLNKRLKKWELKQRKRGEPAEELILEVAMAGIVFPHYVKYHMKGDAKKTWVELEKVFDTDFKGFRLRGRRDGIYKVGKRPKFWLLETKTFSRLEEASLMNYLNFDFQNLFYIVSTEQEKEIEINGVLRNMVRRPGLKNTKGIKELIGRIDKDITKRPDHYFKRYEITYTKKRVGEFRKELFAKLKEFRKWVRGKLPTYKTEGSCMRKFNCQFLQACANNDFTGYRQTKQRFSELEDD